MNLYFLISKNDPNVLVSPDAVLKVRRLDGEEWRGVLLPPGAQIRIRRALAWHPFRDRSETIGWYASSDGAVDKLIAKFTSPDGDRALGEPAELALARALAPVRLPWSLKVEADVAVPDLVLRARAENAGPVFLAVHRALDRSAPPSLCKGRGVEIGPGNAPRVLPAENVDVLYVEQKPAGEWRDLYGKHYAERTIDAGLWDRYVVGEAHDLPVSDASLDFVFSSHVFEHLANPLKHLEIWGSKLRKGGKIVAIVPDLTGARDYGAEPSTVCELTAEYEDGGLEPTLWHYERFARTHGADGNAARLLKMKRSIHVHYYTHASMAALLREACRRFDFQNFSIVQTPNHKDFHLVVIR